MICILLSTYNGEKYLEEQLDSLIAQKDVDIKIIVRDDGSTDRTHDILNTWQAKGLLTWYTGENLKPAMSFMDLLHNAPEADYYAFCDQDDVWLPEKLKVAVSKIEFAGQDKPALYFSAKQLVDEGLKNIPSSTNNYLLTFGEALIINPSTGCTNLFNKALYEIIISKKVQDIEMHDSWVYRLCLAFDGFVYYDRSAYILYRQHSNNVIGAKKDLRRDFKRKASLLVANGGGGERYTTALALYELYKNELPKDNIQILERIVSYKKSLCQKIKVLSSKDIKTFSNKLNFKFLLAIILNKF